MTPILEAVRPPDQSSVATTLKNELRLLNEKITGMASNPSAKPIYPAGIRSEIRKLRSLGYDLVIFEPETHHKPKPASKLRKAISTTEAETSGKPDQGIFDPVQEGLKMIARMRDAEGGSRTGAELFKLYSLTPSTLHRRRKEHRIVFWRDAKHDFHYPVWQFTASGSLLPGVQEVLQIFRSADESRVLAYFLTERNQLDNQSPLTCLRNGEVDKVTAHAGHHHAENTW